MSLIVSQAAALRPRVYMLKWIHAARRIPAKDSNSPKQSELLLEIRCDEIDLIVSIFCLLAIHSAAGLMDLNYHLVRHEIAFRGSASAMILNK